MKKEISTSRTAASPASQTAKVPVPGMMHNIMGNYLAEAKEIVTENGQNVEDALKEAAQSAGVTDYEQLTNKPSIDGTTLDQHTTSESLHLVKSDQLATINGQPLDKPGDIKIAGSGTVDSELNPDSKNAIQNGTVAKEFAKLEADGNVTPEKTSFIKKENSINLFNHETDIQSDFWYTETSNGIVEGVHNQYTKAYEGIKIEIQQPAETKISIHNFGKTNLSLYSWFFIDAQNAVITKSIAYNQIVNGEGYATLTVPEGAKFLCLSISADSSVHLTMDKYVIYEGERFLSEYVPYETRYYLSQDIDIQLDSELNTKSEKPVQNKVVATTLNELREAVTILKQKTFQNGLGVLPLSATNIINELTLVPQTSLSTNTPSFETMADINVDIKAGSTIQLISQSKNFYDCSKYVAKRYYLQDSETGSDTKDWQHNGIMEYMPLPSFAKGRYIVMSSKNTNWRNDFSVICFYGKNKKFISGSNSAMALVPVEAEFVRFSWWFQCADNEMQLEIGQEPTYFVPFDKDETTIAVQEDLIGRANGFNSVVTENGQAYLADLIKVKNGQAEIQHWWYKYLPATQAESVNFDLPGSIQVNKFKEDVSGMSPYPVFSNFIYKINTSITNQDVECLMTTDHMISFRINKSRLETNDLNGVKKYLSSLPYTPVIYAPLSIPKIEKVKLKKPLRTFKGGTIIANSIGVMEDVNYTLNPREYIESKGSSNTSSIWKPRICLGDKLFAVVGDTIQIYFKSIVEGWNDSYLLKVESEKGKHFPEYWEYTPLTSDIGVSPLKISIFTIDGEALATSVINIVTKAAVNPSFPTNVLLIGDSTMQGGEIAVEASRRLNGSTGVAIKPESLSLSNIKIVGRKKNKDSTCGWEGTGGWTASMYLNKDGNPGIRITTSKQTDVSISDRYRLDTHGGTYNFLVHEINTVGGTGNIFMAYTFQVNADQKIHAETNIPHSGKMIKVEGTGSATIDFTERTIENSMPFWNYDTDQWDIKQYVDRYCDGHIEYVCILLGVNNIIDQDPFNLKIESLIASTKDLIARIHSQYPNIKVVLSTIPPVSCKGGIAANYSAATLSGQFDASGFDVKVMALNRAYFKLAKEKEFKNYVVIANSHAQFDARYGYMKGTKTVNNRCSETEEVQTNGVHPRAEGYWMISDALVFRPIICTL